MKAIAVLSVFFMLAWGCTPKATPAATPVPPVPPPVAAAPTPAPETRVNTALLENGKKIYETRCGRCHGLKKVDDYTVSSWVGIMDRMAPKARLDETEKSQALAYVQFYAKDAPKNKEGM